MLSYRLEEGSYLPIVPDEEEKIFSQVLDIWLGMWEGKAMLFEGRTGEPVSTSQALEQLAQQEHQRAERLAERLRQLGVEPGGVD